MTSKYLKDRLGTAALINSPVKNKTQNYWTRLVEQYTTPLANRQTIFSRAATQFGETKDSVLKSMYKQYFGPLERR